MNRQFLVAGLLWALVSMAALGFSLEDSVATVPRVDYERELVFLELWRGGVMLGVERVMSLDEFVDYQLREAMSARWEAEGRREREQRELRSDVTGLIPDIELPKLPVFGEGSRIDITGHDRITVGGRQTNVDMKGVPRAPGQRRLPELKMEQQLAVRVAGTIGERAKINIDHDSQRQEGQNKINLSYEGTEDEIVQSVELGDTRLSIPGTAYTGDLPATSGLFGVSARGKLGGVDLYAVASREESQGQSQSFTGRRRVMVDTIYARSYLRDRFFGFPEVGNVRSIRVYLDDKNPTNNEATVRGIATVLPGYPDSVPAGWSYDRAGGDFDLLTVNRDYVIHEDNVIEFERAVGEQAVVGVVVFGDDTLGGGMHNDSLVLQMLKPEIPDVRSATWDYMLRNAYRLPLQEVTLGRVGLYRRLPGEVTAVDYEPADPGNRKFLELLGLDRTGDGRLQYPEFDRRSGLIRFPARKPFIAPELSVPDSVLYRKFPLGPDEGMSYFLVVEYSSATEAYYLGQVDIQSGSERVHVDGELWARDVDYEINYSTGLLSFRRELPPDAEIRVTFEYRPLFSMSQKTLVGTRAEWKFGRDGRVGTSAFFRNEGMPDAKPALGSEPFRRAIAAADASWATQSDEVTALLDRLPLLRAQAPSSFAVRGEGAVSLPDPNTRGSVWLDDFESTTINRPMTLTARLWSHASVPVGRDTADFAGRRLWWWTPWGDAQRVRKDSVFGPGIGEEGRETQEFLRAVFTPDPGNTGSWAGLMHCPSPMGMNLSDLDNLEIVLRTRRGRGRVRVSVGMSIDEDAPRRARDGSIVGYNGRLDTEDQNGNGIIDQGEDTGLDGVFGPDDEDVPGDDGNDDYDPRENQMGTENNGGNRPDSEDLTGTGFSRFNNYYETTIVLDEPDAFEPLHGPWRLYRIPLDTNAFEVIGNPKWESIKYLRLWFDGFSETDTLDFFSIEFAGSRWRDPKLEDIVADNRLPRRALDPRPGDEPLDDETVWLAQVSRRTNPGYVPPYEPRRDADGRLEQEAALAFGYRNLGVGRRALVSRVSSQRDDYRDYGQLRAWVHDDGNGLKFLLRIGADSMNWYGYTARVTDGEPVPGRGNWYEFVIELDSFPGLKLAREAAGAGADSGRFSLAGNPSLGDIRYLALGIENHGPKPCSGAIWFNDLRLSVPRKDPGYGFQASTDLQLSDFISLGGSFGYSDPNFRRFSEAQGVKTGGFGTNLGVNLRMNLDRLSPASWGLSAPVSYGVSERQDLPKYHSDLPDYRLSRELAADSFASRARDENFALDNLRKQQSGSKLLNYTLEAMGFSWRHRRGYSNTVLTSDSATSTAWRWGYGISPDLGIRLSEEQELSLLPQSIRFGLAEGRNRAVRISRRSRGDTLAPDTTRTIGHGLDTEAGLEYSPLDDLGFEYSVSTSRDLLVHEDTLAGYLRVGTEAGRDEGLSASYSADLWDFLTPSFDYDGEYNDDRPRGPGLEYEPYRNLGNSGEIELGLTVGLPEVANWLKPGPVARDDDSTPAGPGANSRALLASAVGAIDPFELGYTTGREAEYLGAEFGGGPAPLPFRLGFTDRLDSAVERSTETFERASGWRGSSGLRVKDLRLGFGYDWNRSTTEARWGATRDVSTSWPDLDYSLGQVHLLFKEYATDSRLSGRYRRLTGYAGNLDLEADTLEWNGRTETRAHELNPLLAWQTTWKKKITTTASANYSASSGVTWRGDRPEEGRGENRGRTVGGRLQTGYAFSAPRGLRLPFFRGVRFSSDLRLTWALDYSHTTREYKNPDETDFVPAQDDRAWSTRLTGAYMFSRAIEAGANAGFSQNRAQTGISTSTTDLDIWVLFRF